MLILLTKPYYVRSLLLKLYMLVIEHELPTSTCETRPT